METWAWIYTWYITGWLGENLHIMYILCVYVNVWERKSEREREKSHNCTMSSLLDLLMGNEEKDNPGLLSGDNTILGKNQPSYVISYRIACLRNRLEGIQTPLHVYICTDTCAHFLFWNFLSQICLKSKWVELKQGVGEKEPSKNFVQPSKFFKSELINNISQLPNHAPRRLALYFDLEKKCWAFKEQRRKAFAILPCFPPSPPSDHSISPSFFFFFFFNKVCLLSFAFLPCL